MTSIIIVNFNGIKFILKCLYSVLRFCPDAEIIVVDNDSQDGSDQRVKDMMSMGKVKLIKNWENLHYTKAVNQGIKASSGKYVLTLNPDAYFTDDSIKRMVDFMELYPAGACGPVFKNFDGTFQGRGHRFISPLWAFLEFSHFNHLFPGNWIRKRRSYEDLVVTAPMRLEAISGACLMIRRKAWEEVGPFDEGFKMYCEETDWCKRALKKGWTTWHLPDCSVRHFGGGLSNGQDLDGLRKRSVLRYLKKHYLCS